MNICRSIEIDCVPICVEFAEQTDLNKLTALKRFSLYLSVCRFGIQLQALSVHTYAHALRISLASTTKSMESGVNTHPMKCHAKTEQKKRENKREKYQQQQQQKSNNETERDPVQTENSAHIQCVLTAMLLVLLLLPPDVDDCV